MSAAPKRDELTPIEIIERSEGVDDAELFERLCQSLDARMSELIECDGGFGGLTEGQEAELRALLARELLSELRFTLDPWRRKAVARQVRRLLVRD